MVVATCLEMEAESEGNANSKQEGKKNETTSSSEEDATEGRRTVRRRSTAS